MTPRATAAILLSIFPALSAPQAVSPDYLPPTVGVMLAFERKPPDHYVTQLQRDVAEIFRPSNLNLRWEILDPNRQPGNYARALVLDVGGRCGYQRAGQVVPHHETNVKLGWTMVNDGK